MATERISLSGLARRLVDDGILAPDVAARASDESRKNRVPFVTHVVKSKLADATAIAVSACEEFGVPLLSLDAFDPEAIPKDLINEKLVRQHNAIPLLRRGARLFVAVSDPTNLQGLDEIKFQAGINVEPVLVQEDRLAELIERTLAKKEDDSFQGLEDDGLEDIDLEAVDETKADDEPVSGADDTPIVRFVNKMLLDAIRTGASDIHFEPYEKAYRVRFRTDGILNEISKPPVNLGARFAARLKVMSQMDISERRVPQDGRIKMKLSKTRAIDFRVNTLPTLWGEKVVLRILDPSSAKLGIDALGYEPEQKEMFLDALHRAQGMVLVTGPTGSGKTVSLYTGLNILNTAERNISTAEDPVEINLEGINQVQVNPKVGFTFAAALRAFLRQDPDVIMVGEIRDLETAEIAIKAAQTGHMVLSTLHTNSAAETLTRLRNMGVPSFNLATSINLIIAARLARRLCVECKQAQDIPREALLGEGFTEDDLKEPFTVYGPNLDGCPKCNHGYKGRVGVFEVVKITKEMARIIMEDGNAIDLNNQARALGFNDLRRSCLMHVKRGVTSLAEMVRVTVD
jgi:type IV pilus assembly protein PilB